MALLAQTTFTIRRLAKDELSLVFSSDTVAIPSENGVADLSTAEFEVKVLKGGRELFPIFDEEIEVPPGWTSAPEDILTNAILSARNCTAVVDGSKIKITSIESGKNAGYVDVTVTYGVGNNVTRRFTWARAETGVSITNVDVEYAVNSSTSTAPTEGWTTLPPISLSSGQQLWSRTVTYFSEGNPKYSLPANITPQIGQGVESIVEEFAISTSKTVQPTEGWGTTQPTWVNGSYIWSRVKITYKNPTEIKYTGYAVSSEWEAVNELKIEYDSKWLNTDQELSSLKTRTTSVEDITTGHQTRIEEAESSIIQTAAEISLKVSKDEVVSSINQTAESIKIDAEKIEFTGSVSFKSAAQGALEDDLKKKNATFFAKPSDYQRGDTWYLTKDETVNGIFYRKGTMLHAAYATGQESDWRQVIYEPDATSGVNILRNYDLRFPDFLFWGGVGTTVDVNVEDLPTEFYKTGFNILADEYGFNYPVLDENGNEILM